MNHSPEINLKEVLLYGLRWVFMVILMEIMLHLFYVVAIKDSKAWEGFSPIEIFAVGYYNLNLIWLKLTIIWRLFRLWAMADGIITAENMTKCMSNHNSGIGFWRNWHKSYNDWLIRYLYIPLDGKKYRIRNSFIIFTFVAFWHDIKLRLFAWGWLITVFIAIEVFGSLIMNTRRAKKFCGSWHIYVCALGGLFNILVMMTINLIGFAVGVEGIILMLKQFLQPWGIIYLLSIVSSLYSFVLVQYSYEGKYDAKIIASQKLN